MFIAAFMPYIEIMIAIILKQFKFNLQRKAKENIKFMLKKSDLKSFSTQ